MCFSTFSCEELSLCSTSNKIKKRWKREWVVQFQLSDSIWSSLSLRLNLNEMSDFEAVAKLLKVCQWDSASELKDTLRLAENKEVSGVCSALPANAATTAPACVCVCLRVCEGDQLKATTCIVRRWTAPVAKPSGASRPVHPNLPSNRGGVCVYVCAEKGSEVQERKNCEVRKWHVVNTS